MHRAKELDDPEVLAMILVSSESLGGSERRIQRKIVRRIPDGYTHLKAQDLGNCFGKPLKLFLRRTKICLFRLPGSLIEEFPKHNMPYHGAFSQSARRIFRISVMSARLPVYIWN